jgi:outer membrane lipoprotein-sorting protein
MTFRHPPRFPLLVAAGTALLIAAGPASAQQGQPMSLTPPGPRPGTATPGGAAAPAAEETPRQMLDRINRSLNGMATLIADFTQINADGRRRTGQLYLMRPGKLKFEYDKPLLLEVIADGSNVAVLDKRLPQQDIYGINQTPLKFLVRDRIDIGKDVKVLSVRRQNKDVVLEVEDSNTVAGKSRIRIVFDAGSYQLRQWTVTDAQNMATTVQLSNIDTARRPDRSLFVINYQFSPAR